MEKHEGIWMGQELWLNEKQLSSLGSENVSFLARSGMEQSCSSGIYRGRPHGGVTLAWNKNLGAVIKPLSNHKHERVVAAEIESGDDKILLVCVYLPFLDSRNRTESIQKYVDCITMVENIIDDFPGNSVIVVGDFNTELKGGSPYDNLLVEFMNNYNLICCDHLTEAMTASSYSYTYAHESHNQFKWNDHFLFGDTLTPRIKNMKILEDGDNTSDHLPVMFDLEIDISCAAETSNPAPRPPSLIWEILSDEQKSC
jgi:exonuclease III